MTSKNIWITVSILLLILIGVYVYWRAMNQAANIENNGDLRVGEQVQEQPEANLKTAKFSGKLEQVNVGCFVDGECYVVVDGKHVTTTLGWRQEVVGSVQGVESIGELEGFIGGDMEVYAQDKGDGTYTLYGSPNFYVKFLGK